MRRLLLSIALAGLWPGLVAATTLHVPSVFPSIQAAIPNATSGDTILVAPGSYVEQGVISLPSGIRLIGDGGRDQVSVSTEGIRISWVADTTVVEGLTVSTSSSEAAITVFDSPVIIRDNHVVGYRVLEIYGIAEITRNIFDGTDPTQKDHASILLDGSVSTLTNLGTLTFTRNQCLLYGSFNLRVGSAFEETLIDHNTFLIFKSTSGALAGVLVISDDPTRITNNIFYFVEFLCANFSEAADVVIDYNCFRFGHIDFSCDDFAGPNNIDADPWLCDIEGRDWRLLQLSPCIGAGEGGSNIGPLGICTVVDVPQSSPTAPSQLILSPNPARRWTNLVLDGSRGPAQASIFDAAGRLVRRALVDGNPVRLELVDSEGRSLPAGVYFVRVRLPGDPPSSARTRMLTVID